MSLTNFSFIGLYFPLILIAYYNPIFKKNGFRKLLLVMASLGLYAFCEPIYVLLLIAMILINYLFVSLADRFHAKAYRIIAIIIDVSVLLLFKYINKVIAFGLINADFSLVAFPIGLSYFTFKSISYVVDSSEEKKGNVIDVAIYIANFLTIVSGPLSTYKDELPSIREKKEPSFDNAYNGFERIMLGLGKKIIIADSLNALANQCFLSSDLSVVMSWAGAIAYTLQLFFDFSGYTDMALGVGYFFGFDLPENFNYPYMANSVSDFWKKWHISLTKWFTKYIYIPLGGTRVKTVFRHILNLFVVWLVTGMWHGSSLTFIVWAMVYFVLQVLEKYTGFSDFLNRIHVGRIYTLLVVVIEWVIFKSESLENAFLYIGSMFGCTHNAFCVGGDLTTIQKYIIPMVLGIVFSTNIGVKIKNLALRKSGFNIAYNIGLIALFVVCILITISAGYSAPLYAGF